MSKLYIGFMSGTSLDGVDASLVKTDGDLKFEALGNTHIAYPKNIKLQIKDLTRNMDALPILEKEITHYHIKAAQNLLEQKNLSSKDICALGFHGQTIMHKPEIGYTMQIGNPHMLAKNVNIDVVHDFRRSDLALWGQGAPLVPIFHKYLMQNQVQPAVVLNIGGVANLTYIDKKTLIAFDTGTGNALIDDAMRQYFNHEFDKNGKIASIGNVDHEIVNRAMSDEYFSQKYPKSLDRDHFKFLTKLLSNHTPEDIISTLTYITSATIAHGISNLPKTPEVITLCGGGAKNIQMISWLKSILLSKNIKCKIEDISVIDNHDPDYIESQAFAYLAARFCNNLPSAFPNTTGARKANICGCLVKY
ncbi:anhydro-N-acetylmuramic acid kinase [Rickettsiaceae bacterium]|nr:anhydro-N-acetylmuramic acid kinase [Rickettsiaceae bacterium]